jgi:hypothetical protein
MRRRLETNALINVTMTIMLNNVTILFMRRAGIMANKVRKTFKINTVWIVTVSSTQQKWLSDVLRSPECSGTDENGEEVLRLFDLYRV